MIIDDDTEKDVTPSELRMFMMGYVIVCQVAAARKLPVRDLTRKFSRDKTLMAARIHAMREMREAGLSYPQIARVFRLKSHQVVIYMLNKAANGN